MLEALGIARCLVERTVNRYGYVSIQSFSIYAERGLARQRVAIWIDIGERNFEDAGFIGAAGGEQPDVPDTVVVRGCDQAGAGGGFGGNLDLAIAGDGHERS